jgi:phosphatidylserine/phosphatidylglycerophosphate/cardiolipin synthase-like enzyme
LTLSLSDLKSKWFIPMDGSAPDGVPCRRAPLSDGTAPSISTDGNTVVPLVDGKDYMHAWHSDLLALCGEPEAELYHAGWRFEGQRTLGAIAPESNALKAVTTASRGGVDTYVLACANLGCIRFNQPSIARLRFDGIRTACLDSRFPPAGSNHQKFAVMKSEAAASAVLGSVDIAKTRWDSPEHLDLDPERHRRYGKQTHETAVRIEGPAIVDIEKTFRERWNDPTNTLGLLPVPSGRRPIETSLSSNGSGGPHSVQVLRTYGITGSGYSWSEVGEFTIWASYLNAIKRASTYIYIEDQYFFPFDWPPCHARSGPARDTDLFYQLGEAMKRGVNIVVVASIPPASIWRSHQKYQREVGMNYLRGIRAAGSPGDIVFASLRRDKGDIYVHSKIMIVDDEFVIIGSANIAQRSMTYDSELNVGIVDEENRLAHDFRVRLWSEHTGLAPPTLSDPDAAFSAIDESVRAGKTRLRDYSASALSVYPPSRTSMSPPPGYAAIMRRGIDPYGGPANLR